MISSPITWGAGLACVVGGAIAGTALGSTPVIERASVAELLPQTSAFAADIAPTIRSEQLPDHYPLVTRRGTVPVDQLAERGLYSQPRYRAFYAPLDYEPLSAIPDDYHIDDYRSQRDEPSYTARDNSAQLGERPAPPSQEETRRRDLVVPLRLAEGPATLGRTVQPIRIDVTAELAR